MLSLRRKKGIEVFPDCWEAYTFDVSETSCCMKILCTVGEMGEQMLMKTKQMSIRPWVKKHDRGQEPVKHWAPPPAFPSGIRLGRRQGTALPRPGWAVRLSKEW